MLEGICHGEANCSFVTLTYASETVRSVEPRELQLWLKRLREYLAPRKIRFFGVGEYGDQTWRPHYHAALFGLGPCSGGRKIAGECQCASCFAVRSTWGFGHVLVCRLEVKSAQYIAGYILKKMTRFDDPRLMGRHPEFKRQSLKPGLGAYAMDDAASVLMQYSLENRDVPTALRHGSRLLPLGRYLRQQLRLRVGLEKNAPKGALQEAANRLSIVRRYAFENSRSVQSVFEELNTPYEAELLAREKLRKHYETL